MELLFGDIFGIGKAVAKTFYAIWLGLANNVYLICTIVYKVFFAVSKVNLFGSDEIREISNRVFTIIGIVMLFVLAYNILLNLSNPDKMLGQDNKSLSGIAKNLVVSIVLVIFCPLIFKYMSVFQTNLLESNTIGNIILGGGSLKDNTLVDGDYISEELSTQNGVFGKLLQIEGELYKTKKVSPEYSMTTTILTAFLHPINESTGEAISVSECIDNPDQNDICKTYTVSVGLSERGLIKALTANSKIKDAICEDKMEYLWGLDTIAGIIATWMLLSITLDLGVRVAKLSFYELIAPVPIMMRVIPGKEKIFSDWLKKLIEEYLSVFLRLAVVYFTVYAISLVPSILRNMWAKPNVNGLLDVATYPIVWRVGTVIIILGLLKFAKDGPKEFETLFNLPHIEMNLKKKLDGNPGVNMVNMARGAVYGATTGQGFRDRFTGALRGGAVGLGKDGYNGAVKSIDRYRTEKANGSTFRGRMIDRARMFAGMETQGQSLERKANRAENIIQYDGKKYNKDDFKLVKDREQNLLSGRKGMQDAIKGILENEDIEYKAYGFKGTHKQHLEYYDQMKHQLENETKLYREELIKNGEKPVDIAKKIQLRVTENLKTLKKIEKTRKEAETQLKTKIGQQLQENPGQKITINGKDISSGNSNVIKFAESMEKIKSEVDANGNHFIVSANDVDAGELKKLVQNEESLVSMMERAEGNSKAEARQQRLTEKYQHSQADSRMVTGTGKSEKK